MTPTCVELELVEPLHHVGVSLGHEQVLGAVVEPQPEHVLLLRVGGCDLTGGV